MLFGWGFFRNICIAFTKYVYDIRFEKTSILLILIAIVNTFPNLKKMPHDS